MLLHADSKKLAMISGLAGNIIDKTDRAAIIDVHGVRYEVNMSATSLAALPAHGAAIEVWTRLIPSDDALTLFGFGTLEERKMFDLLRSVSGVGPRLALNILSSLGLRDIVESVAQEKPDAFLKVARLGRKTAGKIILELKNKINEQFGTSISGAGPAAANGASLARTNLALQALLELGYSSQEAKEALESVSSKDPGEQVREALRQLGSHATVSR